MDFTKIGSAEESLFTQKVNEIKKLCEGDGNKIMVSHVGEIEQEMVNTLSNLVESQMVNNGIAKGVVKKVFNIVIETLQNISIHGAKDSKGLQMTYFIIGKHDSNFTVYSGNITSNDNIEKMKLRLDALKALDDAALKQHYMDVLSNGELSKKGGAGLGFITIALKANNNTSYEFTKLNNDYSLFSFQSKVIS